MRGVLPIHLLHEVTTRAVARAGSSKLSGNLPGLWL
jgi:hypothetical protein